MLHEILMCLYGFPGDICTQVSVSDPAENPETRLKLISDRLPFITQCECSLVSQLHEIGDFYLRLKKFIENYCVPGSGSLYLSALAFGMDEYLLEYRSTLVSIESELLKTPQHGILYIVSRIEPFRHTLSSLVYLLDNCIKEHKNSGCIINCLNKVDKSPAIVLTARQLMKLFCRQLSSWLLLGKVDDPYGEFFISDEYELNVNRFPTVLSPKLANDILYAGKAVCFGDPYLSDTLEEKFAKRFEEIGENLDLVVGFDPDLEQLIRDIWRYVSAEVWRRMLEEYELVKNLKLVRNIYLLGRGGLFMSFFDNLLSIETAGGRSFLDQPIPSTVAHAKHIAGVVNSAFLLAARSIGVDDKELSERFKFVVSTNPTDGSLPPISDAGDGAVDEAAPQLSAWDCLRLEMVPPRGLEGVFSETARASYSRLFGLLLTLRRTEHALNAIWRGRLKCSNEQDHAAFHLHHRMVFVVNHIYSYLQVDVIATAFERLLETFDKQQESDLGCVEAVHEAFLRKVESQALLHHPYLHSTLLRLLHVCRRPPPHRASAAATAAAAEFEHLAASLFATLSATAATAGSDCGHLYKLLLRLDYNNAFSTHFQPHHKD